MKALTVKEVIAQFQHLLFEGKVGEEDWVIIEGCDCNGYVSAVEVEVNERFVPRTAEYDGDGMFVTEHRAPGPALRLKRMGNH